MTYIIIALVLAVAVCAFLIVTLRKTLQEKEETEQKLQSAYENSHALNEFYKRQEEIKKNEKETQNSLDTATPEQLMSALNDIVQNNNDRADSAE